MLHIRLATPQDADAIALAHFRAWRAAYRDLLPAAVLDGLSLDYLTGLWRERLAAGEPRAWVARRDGAVVGFASFGPSTDEDAAPGTGAIHGLYLVPEEWGTGAGYSLWRHAHEALLRDGFQSVHLWVIEQNSRARSFYERQGGTLDAASRREKELHGAPVPQLRYRWSAIAGSTRAARLTGASSATVAQASSTTTAPPSAAGS